MAKPVLLTVDDDPEVLRAVERDLRRKFSDRVRVIRADSGKAALDTLSKLKQRNEDVALMLVDQRMPHMTGVDFLQKAIEIYPDAKRVLLTAYADTDAAIKAINQVRINNYLLKPWDPPETQLYPVIEDLLEEWQGQHRQGFDGTRVVGDRWSPQSYEVRDFLARHHVPYRWIDIEAADREADAKELLAALNGTEIKRPFVVFPDGARLEQPTGAQLAERLGLHTTATSQHYDLIIVGGGPAGLAAAVYGASEGLRTVMIEREAPGGQAALSSRIENYLGFPSGLSGSDLARRAVAQATRFGVEILAPQEVTSLRVEGQYKFVKLPTDVEISCQALLIATGVQWCKLNVPGADRLLDAGVYYGAAPTEANSCQNEDVYVVGGANSAGQGALNFARVAKRVVMLVRAATLSESMSQYLIDQIQQTPNIEVEFESEIKEFHGQERLETITVHCGSTNEDKTVPASAVFIFIGAVPHTQWLEGVVERDERGFILAGRDLMHDGHRPKGWPLDRDPWLMETSVPGIFAVGDVRHGSVKRVASGVGEGSIAIQFVHQYLSKV